MTTMRADELQPGDRFPLGGIVRTIIAIAPKTNAPGDDAILISYVPTGSLTVPPDTRFRNVTVGGITPIIIINEGAS